jgi:hypothetical protein
MESTLWRRPISLTPCMVHPSIIKLVENNSFSGEIHENPYAHVRDFEQLCCTQGKTEVTRSSSLHTNLLYTLVEDVILD